MRAHHETSFHYWGRYNYKENTKGIRDLLNEENVGWWHWIDGMWLMVSHNPNISVSSIRDKVRKIASGANILVVEIEPKTWSGFGPKSETRNMFRWIHQNWKKG